MPALEYGITHCLDFHSVFVLQEFDLFSPLNIILEILYPETSEIEVVRITFINCVRVLTLGILAMSRVTGPRQHV